MVKKGLVLLLGITTMAFATIATAGLYDPGIEDTPHNIPAWVANSIGAEPCAFCHTPHVPDAADDAGQLIYPLWNRSQQTYTYTMYTSPTHQMYNASTKTSGQLDVSTRACMMCHNGQNSTLINYPGRGTNTGSPDASKYNSSGSWFFFLGNLGTSLKTDHPVAFTYNPSLDQENNGFPAVSGGKIAGYDLPLYTLTGKATGSTGMIGCCTCHEPHDRFNYVGKAEAAGGTQVFFLRNRDGTEQWEVSDYRGGNADSQLCRACHQNRY
jgi:hypothetical protein